MLTKLAKHLTCALYDAAQLTADGPGTALSPREQPLPAADIDRILIAYPNGYTYRLSEIDVGPGNGW